MGRRWREHVSEEWRRADHQGSSVGDTYRQTQGCHFEQLAGAGPQCNGVAERAVNEQPHAYLGMSVFSCAPETLWSDFEDFKDCLDIGHMDQEHHPLVCLESAAFPGPESALAGAPHGAVRFAETDAVVVVAVAADAAAAGAWTEWSGAALADAACGDAFLGATLHEVVEAARMAVASSPMVGSCCREA